MKKQASFTLYIPTIGYPIGKPTKDLNLIIKTCLDARRGAKTDEECNHYNEILEQAYKEKYADL